MGGKGEEQGRGGWPLPAALLANAMFWLSVSGFGAIREGYDHLGFPVSYLGLVGSPNALAFNVLGYLLPGLLLAWSGWVIGRTAAGWVTALLLAMTGLSVALSGIFPADLSDMSGLLTQLHYAAGFLGLLGIAGWLYLAGKAWRGRRALGAWALIGVGAFLLTILATGMMEQGGLAQRLRFLVAFAWYPPAALIARRAGRVSRPG